MVFAGLVRIKNKEEVTEQKTEMRIRKGGASS